MKSINLFFKLLPFLAMSELTPMRPARIVPGHSKFKRKTTQPPKKVNPKYGTHSWAKICK